MTVFIGLEDVLELQDSLNSCIRRNYVVDENEPVELKHFMWNVADDSLGNMSLQLEEWDDVTGRNGGGAKGI